MASEKSKAQADEMFAGERATYNFRDEFDGKLRSLKSQADAMLENLKSRRPAEEFSNTMGRWTQDAVVMSQALEDMAKLLDHVGHTYLQGSEEQEKIIAGSAANAPTPGATYNISGHE